MADRFDIEEGQRIAYSDPYLVEESFSGIVDTILEDERGDPSVAIIECDDGRWAVLDLREVDISALRSAVN